MRLTRRLPVLVLSLVPLTAACDMLSKAGEEERTCTIPIVRITGVEVKPLDRKEEGGTTSYFYSNTLHEQIVFSIRTQYDKVGERVIECRPNDPLYDPMPGVVRNPVEFGGWRVVQFNGPIQAYGEVLAANTNLLEVKALEDDYGIRKRVGPFGISEIHFDRSIYTIPDGTYGVAFSWVTSEGELLADTVEVYIDLE